MLELLRSKLPWPEVFFKDFVASGSALLAAIGLPHLLAALMLFKKHPLAERIVCASGIILMCWIALEWYVWGFVALSNIFFALGLIEAVCAVISLKKVTF